MVVFLYFVIKRVHKNGHFLYFVINRVHKNGQFSILCNIHRNGRFSISCNIHKNGRFSISCNTARPKTKHKKDMIKAFITPRSLHTE